MPPKINQVFVETPLPALLTLSPSEYALDCDVPVFESVRLKEAGPTEVIEPLSLVLSTNLTSTFESPDAENICTLARTFSIFVLDCAVAREGNARFKAITISERAIAAYFLVKGHSLLSFRYQPMMFPQRLCPIDAELHPTKNR